MSRFFHKNAPIYYISAFVVSAAISDSVLLPWLLPSHSHKKENKMPSSYTATFSVPMHCDSCTSDIKKALSPLGLTNTAFSLQDKLVTTTGTAPPSKIIEAIEETGRTAILRGSGKPNNAAVCILETPPPAQAPSTRQPTPVRGLARLIELDERVTMLDLTLTGMKEGLYRASVREKGDISKGMGSVGEVFRGFGGEKKGELGGLEVGRDGRGAMVGEVGWRVWEVVGRGVVVERVKEEGANGDVEDGDGVVLGVVARSAGVWENEKVVCGCSGKTVWEEREEMVGKGMV